MTTSKTDFFSPIKRFFRAPTGISLFVFLITAQLLAYLMPTIYAYIVLGIAPIFVLFSTVGNTRIFLQCIGKVNKSLMPVELINGDGKRYFSLAKYKNDKLVSPIYWSVNVGQAILLPNGSVDPNSTSSYIKWWLPADKELRAEYIMKLDYPDFKKLKNEY